MVYTEGKKIYCEKCGKKIYTNSKFCQFCGQKITSIKEMISSDLKEKELNKNDIQQSDIKPLNKEDKIRVLSIDDPNGEILTVFRNKMQKHKDYKIINTQTDEKNIIVYEGLKSSYIIVYKYNKALNFFGNENGLSAVKVRLLSLKNEIIEKEVTAGSIENNNLLRNIEKFTQIKNSQNKYNTVLIIALIFFFYKAIFTAVGSMRILYIITIIISGAMYFFINRKPKI
ncbi:MAG: zinc ribbon domain-containing protein [Patescibacteria group bacterium]